MKKRKNTGLQTVAVILFVLLASKGLGFIRELVLAYYYGTGILVDELYTASSIISIFFGWIASIAVVFTPIFMDHKKSKSGSEVAFLNTWITISYIIGIACVIMDFFISEFLVTITVPGFGDAEINRTRLFVIIISFTIIFTTPAKLYKAYLSCEKKYISSVLPTLAINIIEIVFIVASAYTTFEVAAFGYACASFAELVSCILLARARGYRWKFMFVRDLDNRTVIRQAIPVFLNTALIDICSYLSKMFASKLYEGAIASLSYATSINRIVVDALTLLITTIFYPRLAESLSEGNYLEAKQMLCKCLDYCTILLIPATVYVLVLATPLVSILFERGAFDYESTRMTASALRAFSVGFLALSIRSLYVYVFYSLKKTKTSTIITSVYLVVYIIFCFILVTPFQHVGLAACSSIAAYSTLPFYAITYANRYGSTDMKRRGLMALKCFFAALAAGIVIYVIHKLLLLTAIPIVGINALIIIIGLIVGGLIYFCAICILRVEQGKALLRTVELKYIKRQKNK